VSVDYPVCPYCHQAMVRAHEQNEEGEWTVRWVCGCRVDPVIVQAMERRLATMRAAGITA